ncbi:MAG: FtsW/RodA/SpoVE family cell cycle protein [Candidatus Nanoarchaeia archaeon]|nr:FtsW/RodA/SpoVE family cell cycle protein [Candidatus Jingweiarchaeum tengchongense]
MDIFIKKRSYSELIILTITIFILIILGVINLYSVTTPRGIENQYYFNQLIWALLGFVLAFPLVYIDYRKLEILAYPIYIICILLLISVFVFGKTAMGAKRWIHFGIFQIQPAEITKLAIIFVISKYFSDKKEVFNSWPIHKLFIPIIFTIIPFLLTIKQPDLGTGIIILLIGVSIILFNKVKIIHFIFMLISGVGLSLFAWFRLLKPYQKKRIFAFLDPESDVLGSAYHSIQSIIAVGSGQIFGKGYMKSTQSQFSFLPEQHTGFIFSN